MGNRKQGRRGTGRMTALIVALTAALMLAVPAAAATVTASDVMIRNTGQEKDDNIIGVLNKGDKVTVISRSVDASGIEWYYIELPNKNTGYVKAQWVDNGGREVDLVEAPVQEEQTQTEEKKEEEEAPRQEEANNEESEQGDEDDLEGIDDWTGEDAEKLAGAPVTDGGEDAAASQDGEQDGGIADSQSALPEQEDNSYSPYTDPNAQYSLNFVTENDGTGSWYVYSYDTDRRISLGDLEKMDMLEKQAQKSAASAGIWRTAACILLVLLIALLIFLYIVLKRNTRTPSNRPGRSRSQYGAGSRYSERETYSYGDNEDKEGGQLTASDEEDEFSPEKDENEAEKVRTEKKASKKADSGKARTEKAVSEEAVTEKAPAQEPLEKPDPGEIVEADPYSAEDEEQPQEEEDEEKPAPRRKLAGLFGGAGKKKASRIVDSEDDEDDGVFGEDEDDYDDDDSYEDDDEEEGDAPRRGGFFGILKNIFHSDSEEDDDDAYEDDDEDEDDEEDDPDRDEDVDDSDVEDPYQEEDDFEEEEIRPARGRGRGRNKNSRSSGEGSKNRARRQRTAERVFDEALDYPEDADLIPDPASVPEKKEAAAEPEKPEKESFYADDDDDMEYSFLNSRTKRGSRR